MPFSQVEHKVVSLVMRLLALWMIYFYGILECYTLFFSVLESGTVSVFIPGKKYGEDADQQLSIPVQCSFWALADASLRSGRTECTILGTAVGLMITLCCNTFIIRTVQMKHGLDLQKQVNNNEGRLHFGTARWTTYSCSVSASWAGYGSRTNSVGRCFRPGSSV